MDLTSFPQFLAAIAAIFSFSTTSALSACDNAKFISQDIPTEMTAGNSYKVTIVMENTCDSLWESKNKYYLGSQSPRDNLTWGLGRIFVPETIEKGEKASFTFSVTAPRQGGTYPFQWRMLQEKVRWFGDYTPKTLIKVKSAENTPSERIIINGKEFYKAISGGKFIPRGSNLIRLTRKDNRNYHTLLSPGYYRPKEMDQILSAMRYSGYNVVRLFIHGDHAADSAKAGIHPEFAKNLVDFLNRSKKAGMYVFLTGDAPKIYMPTTTPVELRSINAHYLSKDHVQGRARFMADMVKTIRDGGAPLEQVFAYSMANEAHFVENAVPLSYTTGIITTATGNYDMSKKAERDRMMQDGLVYSVNTVRAAIRAVDPKALVTSGFFTPEAVEGPDMRIVPKGGPAIQASTADFIDIHPYLPWAAPLEKTLEQYGVISGFNKPVVLGEFGIYSESDSDITRSAFKLRDMQIESCKYGVSGWLLWTWDTPPGFPLGYRTMLESNGAVNGVLAPLTRPDPCK